MTLLSVKNLRKEFGGLVAVKDVSFEVGKGEFVGLIGPNGCGKSTTFNCISGLLEKTSGTVEVFGTDASNLRPDQIQKLGMTRTFQHTHLWKDMTVIENLLVPPRKQFAPNPLLTLLRGRSRKEEKERLSKAFAVLDQLEVPHMAHNLAMVRHEAAEAMGAIGDRNAIPTLEKFREHSQPEIAESCVVALDLMEWVQSSEFEETAD